MGLIDELKKELNPSDALIFYQCAGDVYVEHRAIREGIMGAGRPLDVEQLAKMVRCAEKYAKENNQYGSIGGKVPANLLYASTSIDNMRLVWWRKPEERKMYFSNSLGIPSGVMKVPGVVYSVKNGCLFVWCFKTRKPQSVLYQAPFFNVYNDGRVCLGSARTEKPKHGSFEDWMLYWEKLFWQSEFVHLIGENPIEGNLASVTKKCIKSGNAFPQELLKRAKVKLGELLK